MVETMTEADPFFVYIAPSEPIFIWGQSTIEVWREMTPEEALAWRLYRRDSRMTSYRRFMRGPHRPAMHTGFPCSR